MPIAPGSGPFIAAVACDFLAYGAVGPNRRGARGAAAYVLWRAAAAAVAGASERDADTILRCPFDNDSTVLSVGCTKTASALTFPDQL